MQIQWYPGHMAKARRMLAENLKLIDAVVEIVDARAPLATRNPDFDGLFAAKKRVLLLNKADLASPEATRLFLRLYEGQGYRALPMVSISGQTKAAAVALLQRAVEEEVARLQAKGIKKTVRFMEMCIRDSRDPERGYYQSGRLHDRRQHAKKRIQPDRPGAGD